MHEQEKWRPNHHFSFSYQKPLNYVLQTCMSVSSFCMEGVHMRTSTWTAKTPTSTHTCLCVAMLFPNLHSCVYLLPNFLICKHACDCLCTSDCLGNQISYIIVVYVCMLGCMDVDVHGILNSAIHKASYNSYL